MLAMTQFARLTDAYGRATKIPAILEGLRSQNANTRRKARDQFVSHLVHQGSVYPATVASVPHLLELLASSTTKDKGEILILLEQVAVGDHTNWLEQRFPVLRGRSTIGRCYDAVARATPAYVRLLSDRDPAIREGAAFVLGWLPTRSRDSIPKLRARLVDERNDDVKAGLLLAIGYLGAEPPEVRGGPKTLAAHAIAKAWWSPEKASREELVRWSRTRALRKTRIPWNWGDLAGLARIVARTLPLEKLDVGDAIARLHRARSHEALLAEVEDTLPVLFPKRVKQPSAEQAKWLAALCDREWHYYRVSELLEWKGLPGGKDALRAFIGLRPENPRHLWVRLGNDARSVSDHWRRIVRTKTSPGTLVKALGEDALVAIVASVGQVEPTQCARSIELAVRAFAKAKPARILAAARALTVPDFVMAKTLVILLHRAGKLDASFDARLSEALFSNECVDELRNILAALPLELREKVIAAARPWKKRSGVFLYVDLAPTKRIARCTARWLAKL